MLSHIRTSAFGFLKSSIDYRVVTSNLFSLLALTIPSGFDGRTGVPHYSFLVLPFVYLHPAFLVLSTSLAVIAKFPLISDSL